MHFPYLADHFAVTSHLYLNAAPRRQSSSMSARWWTTPLTAPTCAYSPTVGAANVLDMLRCDAGVELRVVGDADRCSIASETYPLGYSDRCSLL